MERHNGALLPGLLTRILIFFIGTVGFWLTHAEAVSPPLVSPSELLTTARSFEVAQQYDHAVATYQAYLTARPEDDDARGALAGVLSWQGKYDEAVAVYDDILTRHPVDLEVRIALARVKSWQKKFTEAQTLYARVLDEAPDNLEAKRGRADTFYWSGDYGSALRVYEEIFAAAPEPEVAQKIQAVRAELTAGASLQSPRAVIGKDTTDEPSLPHHDYVKVGYSHFSYTKNIPDEKNWLFEAARSLGTQTLVGRVEALDRFRSHDTLLSGELYSPLWQDAWGYIGAAVGTDPQFTPRWTAGGEVFQGLGVVHPMLAFVEPSFGYRHLSFQSSDVNILTPGITVYSPFNVWLTEKVYYVPENDSCSVSSTLTWRATDRLQMFVSGTFGTAAERLSALQDFTRSDTHVWQGGVTFPLTRRISAEVWGYYEDRQKQYVRRGGSFALLFHW
jgi:YaiO family outer membrane protein